MPAVSVNGNFMGEGSAGTFQGTLTFVTVVGGDKPPTIWPSPGPLPHPEHPIVIPPGKPEVPPPSIWPPGPGIDFPSHPIVLPPPVGGEIPPIQPGTIITWKTYWSEQTGWVVVGVPNVPHPSPS